MSDPFHPPEDASASDTGDIDVGEALLTAVYGLGRNALVWIVGLFAFFMAYMISICTCIGPIFIIPPLMWAFYQMTLETVRGMTSFTTMTFGFENYLVALRRVWGWMAINMLLVSPFMILFGGGMFAYLGLEGVLEATQDPKFNLVVTPISTGMTLIMAALFARLQLVPFLLVDRDMPVIEAYAESWRMSEGNWLRLIAIIYFVTLWTLPATTIQLGLQYYVTTLSPLDQISMMGPQFAVSILTATWNIALSLISVCAVGAAYLQLSEGGASEEI